MTEPQFALAINCVDGRAQLPVIHRMKRLTGAAYVDLITQPGAVRVLADDRAGAELNSIRDRVLAMGRIRRHLGIAVVAHHDCRVNPVDAATQFGQLQRGCRLVASWSPTVPILGLWVDERGEVVQVVPPGSQLVSPVPPSEPAGSGPAPGPAAEEPAFIAGLLGFLAGLGLGARSRRD